MAKRPQTIREIQAAKKSKEEVGTITITNCSNPPQMISIHLDAPEGVDFYVGAQDIRLLPRQSHQFRKDRIRPAQIERLQKQKMVRVVSST